ncbi:FKBP-type peptidyl-prolyl cis-trans isomerase [Geobacter pickeringii]|uniref:Peptidyl-prolyl cis-trans isomerase n=1 Tax=Geobacter pickeringii TaxID=345632 RepID=A0A0B5B6Y3_9BACT|nr:peptidylprolyl isomerase [Geobacter pickeringii]AJE02278.1 peptidylprolyl isomerase [Geobacter pickeringii]
MRTALPGDTVAIHYIGTLDDGRIFDSTVDRGEPLVFTIGAGQLFAALEREIVGMAVGGAKNVVIPAAQAYGPRRKENVLRVDRGSFPAGDLVVGRKVRIEFAGGVERVMLVTEVTEATVTLDGNHPLAGLDLTFALKLDGFR